jgi:hypothetical protein
MEPEREALDPTGEPRSPPFKAAVVDEDIVWSRNMVAMMIRWRGLAEGSQRWGKKLGMGG